MKIPILILGLTLFTSAAFAKSDVEDLYAKNPALVTQANPEILKAETLRIFKDPDKAQRVFEFVTNDYEQFSSVRKMVIEQLKAHPKKELARVVVSGQSVTGMIAAAVAAQAGHKVNVYDLRMSYTRDIQWSVRQAVPDELASIDPELAERFIKNLAGDLEDGYKELKMDGTIKKYPPQAMGAADPRRIPQTANELLDGSSMATVQTKEFEKILYDFLSKHPNVVQKKGKIEIGPIDPATRRHVITEYEDVTPAGQKEKVYKKLTEGTPIAILAEGAGSSHRKAIGIESAPISPKRLQVAGVVHIENGGEIVTHFRDEDLKRFVTGSMGTKGSGMRWVVADVDVKKITPDASKFGTDVAAPDYVKEKSRLLEIEFKRIAALNMRKPVESLDDIPVNGAIEKTALATFELQQNLSRTGSSGANVLLLADAVGNGHWSVGGGMHVGAVSHIERFKQFLASVDSGAMTEFAAKKYGIEVVKDSRAWGERGLRYFYDKLDPKEAKDAYNIAADLYLQKKVSTPERALNLMMKEGRVSTQKKNIQLKCDDIARRILGDI